MTGQIATSVDYYGVIVPLYANREERQLVDQTRTYAVVLRPEPEGGYTVRVPAFPEIVTYGADEPEALAMAKEAIELAIEHRASLGEDIPDPQSNPVREVTVSVRAA
jgi:antitoxin HicB